MAVEVKDVQEVAEALGKKFDDFKEKNTDRLDLIEKEVEGMALAHKRPSGGGANATDAKGKAALGEYIKSGDDSGLIELQGKSMSVGSDPDGGFAVPEYLDREVETLELEASAILRLARTVTTTGPSYKKITNLRGTTSGWVGETDERPETGTPKLASIEIHVGELYANPKLTQGMIDDAMFDAEGFITTEVGEEFSDQLATALFTGNGVNKPKGILSKTITAEPDSERAFGSLQFVETGAAAITFDDLKNLKASLRAKYRTGAAWIMNDTTALVLSKIKDADGRYIWRDAVTEGDPDTLLGYRVEIDENAPDISPGAYPVLFGNFMRGYYIVRRTARRLLRDPYTSKPYVNFYTTERVGGDVVNSQCIKLLKVKAA
ncbi:Phage capsid family protein [Pseudomonas fluorescens]|uniref:phage major capsid protein n=1 Tax=Pseudomonas TaxID=286 RepID=UPI000762D356|nr:MULTISPECIES: phage major capsid protein [Pseudomonas]KWV79708.1 Phage capsid family protein [Pseudomonas fluorescens]NMX87239.1 phage major capsid protein [Pseudomonas sp. WS 5010]